MNAHLFTADKGSKTCNVCGKTRNAKAHKEARALDAQVDAATEVEMAAEAAAVAEAREDMLPEVDATTDDAEIADALAALEEQETAKPAKKAATDKHPTKGERVASLWVGWRITNAAVLDDTTLAAKLKAAKPTGDLDRTVKLTVEELQLLDGIAAKFMEPGHTGPEIYSGRALRGRIAAAVAKIEENSK